MSEMSHRIEKEFIAPLSRNHADIKIMNYRPSEIKKIGLKKIRVYKQSIRLEQSCKSDDGDSSKCSRVSK